MGSKIVGDADFADRRADGGNLYTGRVQFGFDLLNLLRRQLRDVFSIHPTNFNVFHSQLADDL